MEPGALRPAGKHWWWLWRTRRWSVRQRRFAFQDCERLELWIPAGAERGLPFSRQISRAAFSSSAAAAATTRWLQELGDCAVAAAFKLRYLFTVLSSRNLIFAVWFLVWWFSPLFVISLLLNGHCRWKDSNLHDLPYFANVFSIGGRIFSSSNDQ